LLLPNIKEESNSDISDSLSLSESIKTPKSSIMNDSDFNNSFTLKKCKLFELKENFKSDAVSPKSPESESYKNNLPHSLKNLATESPLLSPTTPGNHLLSNIVTNPSMTSNDMNPMIVRKSILKNPLLGLNNRKVIPGQNGQKEKAQILSVKLEALPKEKTGSHIITDIGENIVKNKEKRRENVRYYKLMLNRSKEIVSYSKEDVLEYRYKNIK